MMVVDKLCARSKNLAKVTGVAEMLAALTERAGVLPLLMFAFFHTVYRQNRRRLLLAKKRFGEQVIKTVLEVAKPPQPVDKNSPAPLWRDKRTVVPAFSAGTRARQEHRKQDKCERQTKGPKVDGKLLLAQGNWGGNTGMAHMQRAVGNFPRKWLEPYVVQRLKTRYPGQVHAVTLDECATSKRLGKLRVSLRKKHVDKFCPPTGTQALILHKDGTTGTFTVTEGGRHKLLAWKQRVRGAEYTVVANRDEPTVYTFTQIVVHALLNMRHLSHLSTFMTSTTSSSTTLTTQTRGRGRDGNNVVQGTP